MHEPEPAGRLLDLPLALLLEQGLDAQVRVHLDHDALALATSGAVAAGARHVAAQQQQGSVSSPNQARAAASISCGGGCSRPATMTAAWSFHPSRPRSAPNHARSTPSGGSIAAITGL